MAKREIQNDSGCNGCFWLLSSVVVILFVIIGIPVGIWYENRCEDCETACDPLESYYTFSLGCVCITADNYVVRP